MKRHWSSSNELMSTIFALKIKFCVLNIHFIFKMKTHTPAKKSTLIQNNRKHVSHEYCSSSGDVLFEVKHDTLTVTKIRSIPYESLLNDWRFSMQFNEMLTSFQCCFFFNHKLGIFFFKWKSQPPLTYEY